MVLETIQAQKHSIRVDLTVEEYKLLQIESKKRNLTEDGAAHQILKEHFDSIYRRVLSSQIKLRILALLNDLGQMHTTEIGRRLNFRSWTNLKGHLEFLEDYGLVTFKPFGRSGIKFYKVNKENPKIQALMQLIRTW